MEVNEHTEVLIKAIVRGDKKAFGQLFRMWYVRLCLYAESIVRDRDMAEDLVQNLFCMLWEKREEIDRIIDWLRKSQSECKEEL